MTLPDVLQHPGRLPVLASPMFLASGLDLVKAQCQSGVIGSFPALNARPVSLLDEWLHELEEENTKFADANPDVVVAPFAVNQIVHRSNARLDQDMDILVKHKVPIVITSLGAREEINDAVHSYGGIVLHDVINNRFAHKAIERGADGLIAVAAGAGGHAGPQSPFALIQEIREWFDGPLALSGSIAHGRSIAAALVAGADLAYIGSAFLATTEANITEAHRQMVLESTAADIVYSNLFTGVHGNYLRGSIIASGLDPDNLPESDPSAMSFGNDGREVKAWRDIWGAGQGIGVIHDEISTSDLVDRWKSEYQDALEEFASRAERFLQPAIS